MNYAADNTVTLPAWKEAPEALCVMCNKNKTRTTICAPCQHDMRIKDNLAADLNYYAERYSEKCEYKTRGRKL